MRLSKHEKHFFRSLLGLWEESHAPPKDSRVKEITFDPSYSQLI